MGELSERLIKKYRENISFRHMVWITIVYFLAHWFLLVATGRWWDDWVYADKNWDYLYEVMRQSSVPSSAYIDGFLWLFPDGFYRVLVFVVFYHILRKLHFLSKEECFWITLLYVTVPVNDARITWICWPCSFGLFMYWVSFYLATMWKEENNKKRRNVFRILSILALFASFHVASIMMLTPLIIGYFLYVDFRGEFNKDKTTIIKHMAQRSARYMDYWLAPIVEAA